MEGDRYIVNVEGAVYDGDRYLLVVRGPEEDHAAGMLALIGGKLEERDGYDVLEATLRREIREEAGVEAAAGMHYVHSNVFAADDGTLVADIVFLCQYAGGEPRIDDPGEVAEIRWMTASDVLGDPDAPPWLKDSIERAELKRLSLFRSNDS